MACRNCGYNAPEGAPYCPSCGQPVEPAEAPGVPQPSMPAPAPATKTYQVRLRWGIPVGCLTVVLLIALGIAGVFLVVIWSFRSSDVYQEAMARTRAHPQVQQALGQPIEAGWMVTGNLNVSGQSGSADLAIPLSGPKGKGTLYVEARKRAGKWAFQHLAVAVQDGPRIDLLPLQPEGPTKF